MNAQGGSYLEAWAWQHPNSKWLWVQAYAEWFYYQSDDEALYLVGSQSDTRLSIFDDGEDEFLSSDLVAAIEGCTTTYAEDVATEAHGGEGEPVQDLMIERSIEFTRAILNKSLMERFSLSDRIVVANDVVDPDGAVPEVNQNRVVISVIHIGRSSVGLLMTSQFEHYGESLKFIDSTMAFFQEHAVVYSHDYQGISAGIGMPAGIDKMEFHFRVLDSTELFELWGALGATYRPSLVYNLKLVETSED